METLFMYRTYLKERNQYFLIFSQNCTTISKSILDHFLLQTKPQPCIETPHFLWSSSLSQPPNFSLTLYIHLLWAFHRNVIIYSCTKDCVDTCFPSLDIDLEVKL